MPEIVLLFCSVSWFISSVCWCRLSLFLSWREHLMKLGPGWGVKGLWSQRQQYLKVSEQERKKQPVPLRDNRVDKGQLDNAASAATEPPWQCKVTRKSGSFLFSLATKTFPQISRWSSCFIITDPNDLIIGWCWKDTGIMFKGKKKTSFWFYSAIFTTNAYFYKNTVFPALQDVFQSPTVMDKGNKKHLSSWDWGWKLSMAGHWKKTNIKLEQRSTILFQI